MIAATVQGDVDGIPQGSHYASVPMIKPIGRLVGSATATLEDRLTAAVSTPNPSADGLQRDLLWVSGPSLVAVPPDLCVAAGESDRPAIKERTFRLVHVEWEGWANSADFAALLDAEMRALREHGGTRLLPDCRRQRVLSPIDQDKAARGAERFSRFIGP